MRLKPIDIPFLVGCLLAAVVGICIFTAHDGRIRPVPKSEPVKAETTVTVLKMQVPVEVVDPRSLTVLVDVPHGWGTAVPIHRYGEFTVFLTCAHVIGDLTPDQVKLVLKDARRVQAVNVRKHPTLDLAMVLVQAPLPIVEIDPRPVQFGDEVFCSGFALELQHLTHGYAAGPNRCSADIVPGMSGGGVFRNRKLVGIAEAVGTFRQGPITIFLPFIQVFTPISEAMPWIRANLP